MSKINDSAFPEASLEYNRERDSEYIVTSSGLTKLEYTAIQIFCSSYYPYGHRALDAESLRKNSIEQAKLLLQECEESE